MKHLTLIVFAAVALAACGDDSNPPPLDNSAAELGDTCGLTEVVAWGSQHVDCHYHCDGLPFDVGLVLERWQECPTSVCVESQPDGGWDWCPGSP